MTERRESRPIAQAGKSWLQSVVLPKRGGKLTQNRFRPEDGFSNWVNRSTNRRMCGGSVNAVSIRLQNVRRSRRLSSCAAPEISGAPIFLRLCACAPSFCRAFLRLGNKALRLLHILEDACPIGRFTEPAPYRIY